MNFSSRLQRIRQRSNSTQESVADYLGISLQTYQGYEEGTMEPSLSIAVSIAAYFDVPIDCLIGNGFFSNWEEVLSIRNELIEALYQLYPSLLEGYDLHQFSEGQFAHLLPALFSRIYLNEEGNIILEPFLPAGTVLSNEDGADESK